MGLLEANCAATSEALSDRLEGELHGLRRLRVARHLARCMRCRATLASLGRLVRALRTIRDVGTIRDVEINGGSLVDDVLVRIREGSATDGGS